MLRAIRRWCRPPRIAHKFYSDGGWFVREFGKWHYRQATAEEAKRFGQPNPMDRR